MATSPFRTKFSEDIFNHKYRHSGAETWEQLADTLVEDVCRDKLTRGEKEHLKIIISEMKFIPGGRYLYYAGRPFKAFNNCFGGETSILTNEGWKSLDSIKDKTVKLLSPIDGEYYDAQIYCHGIQKLNKITFASHKGNQNHTWTVRATRMHHWPLVDGSDTYDLRIGDLVPANAFSAAFDSAGFAHGFVFGDGNSQGQLRLCAEKDKKYLSILEKEGTVTYPSSAEGDPCLYFGYKKEKWKEFPSDEKSTEYIASFIKGWIAADGGAGKLFSVKKEHLEWFRKYAAYAGLVITGELRSQERDIVLEGKSYPQHKIFMQNYQAGEDFAGFKVISIEEDGEEEVFCPYEPIHNRFVIDGNIDTYNCFLLKCEEDSREDWANLSWKAESCLMTGGGIGSDYSVYRPKNSIINRTGGLASGPLSKMKMINEIGREVQQGGSRRSAIYASLNWKHQDVQEFIHAKDWYQMKVSGTDLTIGDLKEKDFNFPAPLDMTNISVNYDTEWLENFQSTGDIGNVFLENARQALSTGEPGFSFNFYDKEKETLRNACTEVTSEDDSDVCNLGSVNLGNIESIEEFKEVVELATKFLICGTLVADLPYEKVYKIREKNRRLGLGLMGMHEWLMKRGYKYEVTPELHKWLAVYQTSSDAAAFTFADALGISRPVARRAIAPVGSIGILAGTTTGIEPLFAVAMKRRYLKGRSQWVYQYVVDGTAKLMIEQFGIDPENIETALDLASDAERRIKFQADVQDYVDMSISSTINLPPWGSELNNEDEIVGFAQTLAKYAHRLRGFTCYPDGSRGGQPLTSVPYHEAVSMQGQEFEETFHDICVIGQRGGTCGS